MASDIEWTCLRKRRYRSRHAAEKAARHAQRHFGRMHPYRCPFGAADPHYHVGHSWRDRLDSEPDPSGVTDSPS